LKQIYDYYVLLLYAKQNVVDALDAQNKDKCSCGTQALVKIVRNNMSNSYSAIVSQAIDLLDGLSVNAYQRALPPQFPSSIGTHIRHVIDHFTALREGIAGAHIDYNVRMRFNDVELFPETAIARLEDIRNWLDDINTDEFDTSVKVTSEIDLSRKHSTSSSSTLGRELVFVSSHAIHHYALIRVMCSLQNKSLPEFFGYAPATISHIKSA